MKKETARSKLGRSTEQKILDVFNGAYTPEDLIEPISQSGYESKVSQLAETIIHARNEIGAFQSIDALMEVAGVTEKMILSIGDLLNRPDFNFTNEELKYVMWTHGNDLSVENPERFLSVETSGRGTRITSPFYDPNIEPRPHFPETWVHFAIPTPAYALGDRLAIRSVIFNYESSFPPYDIQGRPLAHLEKLDVYDGHLRISSEKLDLAPNQSTVNRYRRIPVSASQNLNWGIGVSVLLYLAFSYPGLNNFWIEFNAVGVEFVTRTGLVVQPG